MSAPSGGPYRLVASINLALHEMLVVGGGHVAERKVRTLLGCGARVTVISPDVTENLAALAQRGEISWVRRHAEERDFSSRRFAILAAPPEESRRIAAMARNADCAVDVCSDGALGDFALCAQFEADGCFVGVSSGGGNPARAAGLKRKIMKSRADLGRPGMTILTRGSPLALAQAELWVEALAGVGANAALRVVASHGDRDRTSDLSSFGFGAFVRALEDELLRGGGDCAVHSLKDMPASLPEGCALASVLERGSARDVLLSRGGGSLDSLPDRARVGTSSLRRRAQISNARPDIECVACRGNIGTRLEKLERGEVDALVLAEAGLDRLGVEFPNAAPLPFITSAGQGAVAAEARAGSRAAEVLALARHAPTWLEVLAERAFLANIGLGCASPIAVGARYSNGEMRLEAEAYPPEPGWGQAPERAEAEGRVGSEEDAAALAGKLWEKMRESPVLRRMKSLYGGSGR